MPKALITGGLGLIGSHIARHLIKEHNFEKVVCLDHFGRYVDSTRPEFTDYRKKRLEGLEENIVIERGDAKYYSVLSQLLLEYQPEYIFHMAALPLAKLDNLNSEEAIEGAVTTTSNMLECIGRMKDYSPKRFVYTSSSMTYGDFQSDIATEDHPQKPKEIYGTMKLAGEVITRGLGDFYKIPYTIIRPSAVFGPTDMNRRVSQIFIEKAFLGQKLKINGADEKLDFSYVKDVAKGFVDAAFAEKSIGETYNLTHGKAHTLLDFVKCLEKHFPNLEYEITERDAFRPIRGTLSIDKANEHFGYSPKYTLQDGVDEYISFIKSNNKSFTEK